MAKIDNNPLVFTEKVFYYEDYNFVVGRSPFPITVKSELPPDIFRDYCFGKMIYDVIIWLSEFDNITDWKITTRYDTKGWGVCVTAITEGQYPFIGVDKQKK